MSQSSALVRSCAGRLTGKGAPAGPAGTGKTETTKERCPDDLGKALAVPVIVFNCSDGPALESYPGPICERGREAGAWACFDEFNRIQVEVIAQQMLTVTHAIRARKESRRSEETFEFVGREIPLNPRFGVRKPSARNAKISVPKPEPSPKQSQRQVFITMNPGYAGRAELPVPDYCLIAEIILYSEGFGEATGLARKMVNLYSLSSEQLSKQDHYDFGMRAVKSVLVMAGQLKRKFPELSEAARAAASWDVTLIRALRDSNVKVPKFLSFDLPLFFGIIRPSGDLYPDADVPYAGVDYGSLQKEIEHQLRSSKLQAVPAFVGKIIQLLETQLVRHGVMAGVVGNTFIGKSTKIQVLAKALTKLRQAFSVWFPDHTKSDYSSAKDMKYLKWSPPFSASAQLVLHAKRSQLGGMETGLFKSDQSTSLWFDMSNGHSVNVIWLETWQEYMSAKGSKLSTIPMEPPTMFPYAAFHFLLSQSGYRKSIRADFIRNLARPHLARDEMQAEASGWLPRRQSCSTRSEERADKPDLKSGRAFRKEVLPDERLSFGKHKGLTFKEALLRDPYYAIWCSEQPEANLAMRRFLKYAEETRALCSPRSARRWDTFRSRRMLSRLCLRRGSATAAAAVQCAGSATQQSFPQQGLQQQQQPPLNGQAAHNQQQSFPQQGLQQQQPMFNGQAAHNQQQSFPQQGLQQQQQPPLNGQAAHNQQQSFPQQGLQQQQPMFNGQAAHNQQQSFPQQGLQQQQQPFNGQAAHNQQQSFPQHGLQQQQPPLNGQHQSFPQQAQQQQQPAFNAQFPHNWQQAFPQQGLQQQQQQQQPQHQQQPFNGHNQQQGFPQHGIQQQPPFNGQAPPNQQQGLPQQSLQQQQPPFNAQSPHNRQQAFLQHGQKQQQPPFSAQSPQYQRQSVPHQAQQQQQPPFNGQALPNLQQAFPLQAQQQLQPPLNAQSPHNRQQAIPPQGLQQQPPFQEQAPHNQQSAFQGQQSIYSKPQQNQYAQHVQCQRQCPQAQQMQGPGSKAERPTSRKERASPGAGADALAAFDGSFEVELGREDFCLLSSKKLPAKAYAALKSLPGAKNESKKLKFHSGKYSQVLQRLRELCGAHKLQAPPNWVLATLPKFRQHGRVQISKKVAHVLLADFQAPLLPADAQSREGSKVLPYQREAVDFALRRGGRVLLGDEMGLGKTAQALTLAAQFPLDFPMLVVCPSSLRGNWREEAARWLPHDLLPDPERHVQVVRKGAEALRPEARVVVVSYDLVAQNACFRQTPRGAPYRLVICDEAHYLKSPSSQRSQALRPLLQKARRVALLTGTPALAKAAEIYALLHCLLPGLLPESHREFCERYCNEKKIQIGRRQVQQWEGSRLEDELHAVLDMVMVRRFKTQVLSQLPAKRRQRVLLDKLSNDQGALKELREKLKDCKGQEEQTIQAGGAPELFRLTGLAKAQAVAEYVQYLVEAECRFLLFAHHQAVMDTLQQTLEKLKTGFIRIDGKTPPQKREEQVRDFRERKDLQVALLSITACGQGLNLQVCSTVVFAELHWTPGILMQAEDRAHRMGQKESVNVHYLIAKDTLDESMYQMLERKQHDVGLMLDGQASRLNAEKVGSKGTFSKSAPELPGDALVPAEAGDSIPMQAPAASTGNEQHSRPLVFKPAREAEAIEVDELPVVESRPEPIDID
ncbi:unnamed protein product [Effrenium voratum]|uniref:Uncharacterized protein n=1 Tax=Effrenium voratum TaxID=2562239 RepID=A0AA36N300_9DINO|nr:unnamed protein product [Effrenium voratum]